MKALCVIALAAAWCMSAAAQPIHLAGKIGKSPVFADLMRNGDTISGWYFYLKAGKEIRLEGRLNPGGFFQIEEYTASTNTRSGSFTGRRKNGHWVGTWRNAAGNAPHAVALDEVRDKLTGISGRFRCKARQRDREYGFTTIHSADLTLAKGRVKALSLKRSVTAPDGDNQYCAIAAGELRQLRAEEGILLHAKAERSGLAQRCSIRIFRAGDYLVIRTGDASRAGDDCRGAGNTMFCSPRSFWSDLIVSRRTQACRSVK
jgi:hypothetical protein